MAEPVPAGVLRGLRVLVVEDDALIAMMIEEVLAEHGAVVCGPVGDAAMALCFADSTKCDLALLDVNLGRTSSVPVAERLRARGVPIAFVTGYGRAGLPAAFDQVPILGKPFRDEDLLRAIAAALAGRQG